MKPSVDLMSPGMAMRGFALLAFLLAGTAGGFSCPADLNGRPWPSVSVQMVTYNRPALLLEALSQVALQQYPGPVEVVVVDDSAESMADQLSRLQEDQMIPQDVNYVYLPERLSIGAKRNLATRSTEAEVICIWDDDDIFTVDRIWKQVQQLHGGPEDGEVRCSAIEVASFYSVPDKSLSVRPPGLPALVYENTLCFTRKWWEDGGHGFGESWEVSGQGEGTLEPWWEEVKPLSGSQEPFLYIYLPSSASGGTALNKNRQPPPTQSLFTLVGALQSGRFPERLTSPHVSNAIAGARSELELLLDDAKLFQPSGAATNLVFDTFNLQCSPVQAKYRRRRPTASLGALAAEYPEVSDPKAWARSDVASRVWATLCSSSLSGAGWLLVDSPPVRILEGLVTREQAAEIASSAVYDPGSGVPRRERASVPAGAAAQHVRMRVAAALGVDEALIEPLRLVRYSKRGQAFEAHVDWIADTQDSQLELLGQRVATALVFLNDVPEDVGGQTDFPVLGLAVTPRLGTALLWPNVGKDGRPLLEVIHEAAPLTEDGVEKVALNVWIRDRPLPEDPAVLASLLQS